MSAFIDEVEIEVDAGGGGNGMVTFRKEKFVPRGGPNGGDGGHGGSVVFKVDPNLTTLIDFRHHHKYRAERGGDGASKDMFGRDGADLVLRVPQGTVLTDVDTGDVVADLAEPNSVAVAARGGVGGRGNAHFANPVHQAPRFAERGEPGEVKRLRLELKLLADVGLLGYPNVGKSTLIAAVSAARPKIADYPFTTLTPNLGVVSVEPDRSFVMADIPGLIEGASEGVGLGHQFLRHLERTRLLVHVLDVSGMTGRDPLADFETINRELELYNPRLGSLQQVVALNKVDVAADPDMIEAVQKELTGRGLPVHRISAVTRKGVRSLLFDIMGRLEELRNSEPAAGAVTIKPAPEVDTRRWEARKVDSNTYEVTGRGIERMVAMTDLENEYGLRRLQRSLDKIGVTGKLKALGARDGDTVRIRGIEFEYQDEDKRDDEDAQAIEAAGRRSGRR